MYYRGDLVDVARGVGGEEEDGFREGRERVLAGATKLICYLGNSYITGETRISPGKIVYYRGNSFITGKTHILPGKLAYYRGNLVDVARGVGGEEEDRCREGRECVLGGAPAHVHEVRHLKKQGGG